MAAACEKEQWTFGCYKRRRIYWLAKRLSAPQLSHCSIGRIKLIIYLKVYLTALVIRGDQDIEEISPQLKR